MRVLVAGSTGVIGSEIARLLGEQGYELICPTRAGGVDAAQADTLRGCCDGVEIVVSAMGGSVAIRAPEKRPYAVTNTQANRNLLEEARRAAVKRFVYVAAHKQVGYAATAYIQSHEAFVEALREAGISHTVLRPTAIFTALAPFLDFARKGIVPLIGDGLARTNPISARDAAHATVENLHSGPESVPFGGPEALTRREIAGLAARAAGKKPLYLSAPRGVARMSAKIAGLFQPRLGELSQFAAAVSTRDCLAPEYGTDTLGAYFRTLATA